MFLNFKNISIKSKLIIIILSVATFSIAAGLIYLTINENIQIKDKFVHDITLDAHLIGDNCLASLIFNDSIGARDVLKKLDFLPYVDDCHLYNSNGILFASFSIGKPVISSNKITFVLKDSLYHLQNHIGIIIPIIQDNVNYGFLQLNASTNSIKTQLNTYLKTILALLFVVVIISFVLAYELQKIISKPILKLSDVLNEIREKNDYSIRVRQLGTDEIGRLFLSFNELVGDIEQKRLERDKAEQALRDSEERLRLVLDCNENFVYVNDLSGKFIYINASPEYGNPNFMIGKVPSEFLNEESSAKFFNRLKKVVETRQSVLEEFEIDSIKGKLWFSEYVYPMKDSNNDIIGIVTISHNITEKKNALRQIEQLNSELELRVIKRTEQLENALAKLKLEIDVRKETEIKLKKAKEEAEMANKLKSEFLANMSHEIRTPMNAILGFSELLLKKTSDSQQIGFINIILSSGETLLALINDILDLSKIEADKIEFHYEIVDLEKVIHEIKNIFAPKILEKKLDFMVNINKNLPNGLLIDELRLRQILFNLVGNAIKFTDTGFIEITANFESLSNDKAKIIMEVRDTGIGIPKEQLKLIFEAFRQETGTHTRQYGGSGLGLAITKRLVDKMNGEIFVESVLNKGSKFTVIFKDIKITKQINLFPGINDYEEYLTQFQPANILIVDDYQFNIRLVRDFLEDMNFTIFEAKNGEEAISILEHNIFDLILMDLVMPIKNGFEVTKYIKSNDKIKNIPVIGFTALSNLEQSQFNLLDGFLYKPITRTKLIELLKAYLPYEESLNPNIKGYSGHFDGITFNLDEFSNMPKEKLKEIVKIFNNKYESIKETVKDAIVIDEVEEFAEIIKKLGKKYEIKTLIEYAVKFDDALQNYNFPQIKYLIKDLGNSFSLLMELEEIE